MTGPLDGVRIADLTTVVMGPLATRMLADMGADVIRIEGPEGDIVRDYEPMKSHKMSAFSNAAKMDDRRNPYVRRGDGRRVLKTLAPHASSSPSTSLKLCPASASRANEFAKSPKTTSTTTNTRFNPTPIAKARLKLRSP